MSQPDTCPMQAFAWTCVVGAALPLCLVFLTMMGASLSGPLLFLSGLGVAASGAGLVTCVLAFWMRPSAGPIPPALLLLGLGALSVTLLAEALDARGYESDLAVCLRAEREGQTISRGERGYKPRRDQDGDGLACESVLGPQCYEGRCAPFG